jgi:hypothetical protein
MTPVSTAAGFRRQGNIQVFGIYAVRGDVYGLAEIHGDLRAFIDFVRSLDDMVNSVALRPGDDASLHTAVRAIERAVDERARRPPRHPDTNSIARDLKETRIAAVRQRFASLSSRADQPSIPIPRSQGSVSVPEARGLVPGLVNGAVMSESVRKARDRLGESRTHWARRIGARLWPMSQRAFPE